MDKNIFSTFQSNKPKPFAIVKPFHRALTLHNLLLSCSPDVFVGPYHGSSYEQKSHKKRIGFLRLLQRNKSTMHTKTL
jgi:hypothetical protein